MAFLCRASPSTASRAVLIPEFTLPPLGRGSSSELKVLESAEVCFPLGRGRQDTLGCVHGLCRGRQLPKGQGRVSQDAAPQVALAENASR